MKIGKSKVYKYYKLFSQGFIVKEIYNQHQINKLRCGRKTSYLETENLNI